MSHLDKIGDVDGGPCRDVTTNPSDVTRSPFGTGECQVKGTCTTDSPSCFSFTDNSLDYSIARRGGDAHSGRLNGNHYFNENYNSEFEKTERRVVDINKPDNRLSLGKLSRSQSLFTFDNLRVKNTPATENARSRTFDFRRRSKLKKHTARSMRKKKQGRTLKRIKKPAGRQASSTNR